MWNADLIGYRGSTAFNRAYEGGELVWEKLTPFPKSNEIWYTSTNGNIITPTEAPPVSIVSNTYIDGKGIIKFSGNITSIWKNAFSDCLTLSTITIPDGITYIGNRSFMKCRNLSSINIPDGITYIDVYAFYHCDSLTSIIMPNTITIIKDHAFIDCRNLRTIILSNRLTTILSAAFVGCALSSIIFPLSLKTIGNITFYFCYELRNISYMGTTAQWNTITKGNDWNRTVPATVVHCSDGDVPI